MKNEFQTRQIVALTLVKNMGPIAFKKLFSEAGSVGGIFDLAPEKIKGLAPRLKITHFDAKSLLEKADEELEKASDEKTQVVTFFDENYPEELRNIYDPPILLYVKGRLPKVDRPRIAIVGSRLASLYGLRIAQKIARELAASGVVVVSGLALGIDSAAHKGALEAEGRTLAVLGGGISRLYPTENIKIAEKITENGALISEYPMHMSPEPGFFPVRNRIISGLSQATLVVEAREKSGALITADLALEQGRDVFAIPGNADSDRSRGTNGLLKQGAKLVTEAEDILNELGIVREKVKSNEASLDLEESRILSFMDEPLHVDTLVEQLGMPVSKAISTLSLLEIKGYVEQLPGKNFVRKSR